MTELIYEEFKQYEVAPQNICLWPTPGLNYKFIFPNGYGASVIKNVASYGHEKDLFELAVLKKVNDEKYILCYDTPFTDDVIGYLTNDDILELLEEIKNYKED